MDMKVTARSTCGDYSQHLIRLEFAECMIPKAFGRRRVARKELESNEQSQATSGRCCGAVEHEYEQYWDLPAMAYTKMDVRKLAELVEELPCW
jgi:hypothetical protein